MYSYGVSQSTDVVGASLGGLWLILMQYVPTIIAALIIFVIGLIFGTILYRAILEMCKLLRIDAVSRSSGMSDFAKEVGFNLDIGKFIATLVMWFIVLAFLLASLDILGLTRVTVFLEQVVLLYIPQVIVASIILVFAAVIADVVQKVVRGSAHAAGAHQGAHLAGAVAKWAIWILAILAALEQLGVAVSLIQTLLTGFVLAVGLAFGIAFGLGGKDAAARAIEHMRSEVTRQRE